MWVNSWWVFIGQSKTGSFGQTRVGPTRGLATDTRQTGKKTEGAE
jgi:hypothetical protein